MSENQFSDEFFALVISSASMKIFDSNTLISFQNRFYDEIQLAGDWRVALSRIFIPTQIEHILNGDILVCRLKGYKDTQKFTAEDNVISRPYNEGESPYHDENVQLSGW